MANHLIIIDMYKILLTAYFGLLLLAGCRVVKPVQLKNEIIESSIVRLRDSILQQGLDGEALYTLMGDIKPLSSVVAFSLPIGNADSSMRLDEAVLPIDSLRYLARINQIQQAVALIDLPDLKFVLVPYRSAYSKNRILQLSVIRVSKLDSLLEAKSQFFGQYGFVPGTDPAVLLTVNEYEKKYERLRGYGYLFGYPDYAVDFFVRAFQQSDATGKHVSRKFFHIPTFEREEGNFVYAYPIDYTPGPQDSTLYRRSETVLKEYKLLRSRYIKSDSTLSAYELLRDIAQSKR